MRYKVGSVIDNAKPSRLGKLFAVMADSKTVNFVFHANDPGIGLASHADFDFFKLFMGDTGLFITTVFNDKEFIDRDIYRELLDLRRKSNLIYLPVYMAGLL